MTGSAEPHAIASVQITGARTNQEDALAVQVLAAGVHAGEVLLVLADGMGGHSGGELASRLVVDQFCKAYANSPANLPGELRSSLDSANERLADAVAEAPRLRGMGTTLVGCVVREGRLYWISVGDSPLWLCRSGALQRLNADHSMVPLLDDMVRTGLLDREAAMADVRRSLLRSAVAGKSIDLVDLCPEPVILQAGDIVVLASDGVETLAEEQLATVLHNPHELPLQQLAANLMAAIEAVGKLGQDNASVILYRY